MSQRLFTRRYDVGPEMLMDFVQQAMGALPTITSYRLDDSGDRITFTTSLTLTSWGENMVAEVQSDGPDRSVLSVSGEPRVGVLSTPWGEEMHAATIEAQLFAALAPSVELARTNPIMMLQADHRRVEGLFGRIQATEGRQRERLVEELLSALRVHMELEETHVYPLLAQEVDPDLGEEAEVEHQLARDGLAQLLELTPDEPGFDSALAMVIAGIEHHVQEEENEAFPRLTAQLGADRLADLARELTSARADLLAAEQNAPQGDTEDRSTRGDRSRSEPDSESDRDDRSTRGDLSVSDQRPPESATDASSTGADLSGSDRTPRNSDTEESSERDDKSMSDQSPRKRDTKAASTQDKAEAKSPRPPRPKRQSDRPRTTRSNRKTAKVNPDDTTKADLVQQAKKAGVSGYSHMSKAELAKAITKAK